MDHHYSVKYKMRFEWIGLWTDPDLTLKSRHGLAFLGAVFRTGSTDPILMPRPLGQRQDDFPIFQVFISLPFFHFFKQVSQHLSLKPKWLPLNRTYWGGLAAGVASFFQAVAKGKNVFRDCNPAYAAQNSVCGSLPNSPLFVSLGGKGGPHGGKFKRGLRKISLGIIIQPFNIIGNIFLRLIFLLMRF